MGDYGFGKMWTQTLTWTYLRVFGSFFSIYLNFYSSSDNLPPAVALPSMVVMVVMIVVIVVDLLVDWHMDSLVDGDVLNHGHMHLLNMMMVVCMHFVGDVDDNVLT